MNDETEKPTSTPPDPGVFLTKGMQVTIASISIRFNEDGSVEADPVTLHTGLDLSSYWLEIALSHLAESERAHENLMIAKESEQVEAIAEALRTEFISGMQTIMASAVAIDAYYANVKGRIEISEEEINAWRRNGTARYKQIAHVFCMAFKLSQASSEQLREILKEIFKFRDRAVHPNSQTMAPALHPELNKVSDWRYAVFRNHNAKAVARLALTIVDSTSSKGTEATELLSTYCGEVKSRIKPILARWNELYGDPYGE